MPSMQNTRKEFFEEMIDVSKQNDNASFWDIIPPTNKDHQHNDQYITDYGQIQNVLMDGNPPESGNVIKAEKIHEIKRSGGHYMCLTLLGTLEIILGCVILFFGYHGAKIINSSNFPIGIDHQTTIKPIGNIKCPFSIVNSAFLFLVASCLVTGGALVLAAGFKTFNVMLSCFNCVNTSCSPIHLCSFMFTNLCLIFSPIPLGILTIVMILAPECVCILFFYSLFTIFETNNSFLTKVWCSWCS